MSWLFAGRSLSTRLAVGLVIAMAGQLSAAAAEPQPVVTFRAAGRGAPYLCQSQRALYFFSNLFR